MKHNPTIVLQTRLDITLVAYIAMHIDQDGIPIGSRSGLLRKAIERYATSLRSSTIPMPTVEQAYTYLDRQALLMSGVSATIVEEIAEADAEVEAEAVKQGKTDLSDWVDDAVKEMRKGSE